MPVLTPEDLNQKLGLKTEPKRLVPLSPGAADLMPMPSNVVYPMSEREAESFSSRGVRVDPMDVGRAYEIRADRQSEPAKFANAVVGGVIGALGVALEDMSYMTLQPVGELTGALDEWEQNIVAGWGEQLKEARREYFPIYTKEPNEIWNFYNILGDLIENGLGFAVPGAGLARAGMGVARLIGKAGSIARRADKINKLANLATNFVGAETIAGVSRTVPWAVQGFISNHAEGTMMGFETYNKLLEEGYSSEEAAQRADEVRNWNRALFLTDAFALKSVYQGMRSTRNLIADPTNWRKNLKSTFTELTAENPIFQGFVEGGEEMFQGVIQREIENRSTKEYNQKYLADRVGKYMQDESLWYEGFLGLISGGVQSKGMEYLSSFLDNRNASKLEKQIVALQDQMEKETNPETKESLKAKINDLNYKYETSTKKGAYKAQQYMIESNAEFLKNEISSLIGTETLIKEAFAKGEDFTAKILQQAKFVNLVFQNAQRGTLGSLEESLKEMLSKEFTKEELADMNLDENYKTNVQQGLQMLNELEKNYLESKNYFNPQRVYSGIQNVKLANQILENITERLLSTRKEFEKRFGSRAPKGVTLNDALFGEEIEFSENLTEAQKKSITHYVDRVRSFTLYDQLKELEKEEEHTSSELERRKKELEYYKSSEYENEIKDKIKKYAELQEAFEEAKKEADDKHRKSQKNASKAAEDKEAAGAQSPPVKTEEEDILDEEALKKAAEEEARKKAAKEAADKAAEEGITPEEAEEETGNETPDMDEADDEASPDLDEESEDVDLDTEFVNIGSEPIPGWNTADQNDNPEAVFSEDESMPLTVEDLNSISETQTENDKIKTSEAEKPVTGEFMITRRTRVGVQTDTGWRNRDVHEQNESTRNILDYQLTVPGTKIVLRMDPDAKQMTPVAFGGTSRKDEKISYNEYLKEVAEGTIIPAEFDYLRIPIGIYAVIDGQEKLTGYVEAIVSTPNIRERDEFMQSELFILRTNFMKSGSQIMVGEITSREEGIIMKTDPAPGTKTHPVRNSRVALKDATRIVVFGLNDQTFPPSGLPSNLDTRYIETLKQKNRRYKGATFAILPDGGMALLRNDEIASRHKEMLAKAIELAIKHQASLGKTPYQLTDQDKKLLKQFESFGYNLKTRKGIETFLKKYIFLKGSDKSYQVNDTDKDKYTSNLAKWAFLADPKNALRSWISIEQNGIAIVNNALVQDRDKKKIGISLGSNTNGDWLKNNMNIVLDEINTLLDNVTYNTDVGSIDLEFNDVYMEGGNLMSVKKSYNDHIYENSKTDVVGADINTGTDLPPKYSYRANPIVMYKITGTEEEVVSPSSDLPVTEDVDDTPAAATPAPKKGRGKKAATAAKPKAPAKPKASRTKKQKDQDDVNDAMNSFFDDEGGSFGAIPTYPVTPFDSMFSFAIQRLIKTNAIQKGVVTNIADFSREMALLTNQMKQEISSIVGQEVRLAPVAIVDNNGRVIKNQRTFDLYKGLTEGFASEDVRYLLTDMPWLNNIPAVKNATVNQIKNSASTKTICK